MKALICSILLALCTSCATTTLWDETCPNERVWVDASSISEQELIKRKLPYEICENEWGKGYLVEKTKIRKLSDYAIRTLGTPIMVTVDIPVAIVALIASDPKSLGLALQVLEAATRN